MPSWVDLASPDPGAAAGGTVLMGPFDVLDAGRPAVLADPTRAVLGRFAVATDPTGATFSVAMKS